MLKQATPYSLEKFTGIVKEYQNRVYNQAYRMLGNSEDAEETTQDIFLKVYHSLTDFRGDSALSTWIYRITANECISRLRKKQLKVTSMDEPIGEDGETFAAFIADDGEGPEETVMRSEMDEIIRDEVQNLPPNWAMAISLFHFDDLSYDEIAEAMDIPRATVGTYILRGRNQLAKKLAQFATAD